MSKDFDKYSPFRYVGNLLQLKDLDLPVKRDSAKFYYVDGKDGNDGNSGEYADEAFKTIVQAITTVNARINWSASPWATGDIIFIAPGVYAENIISLPHGASMIGLGHDTRDAQLGVKIKPATGAPLDVNSVINSYFENIGFESADASRAFDATICNNNVFKNCRFSGAAESQTCVAAFYTSDAVANRWINCDFTCAAVGFDVVYVDGGDSFSHNELVDCRIHQCTTAGIRLSTNLVGPSSIAKNCSLFGGGATMAIGVDDNSGILELDGLSITATDPVQGCRAANACYGNGALLGTDGEV